jgi:hypothetical protein
MKTQTKISIEQAYAAADRGDLVRARAILRNAAVQDPECEEIYMLFAEWAQKREHAVQCYEKVLRINPNNFVALEALHRLEEAAGPSVAEPAAQPPESPPPVEKSPPRSKPARRLKISFGAKTAVSGVLLVIIAVGASLAIQAANRDSPITDQSIQPTFEPTESTLSQEPQATVHKLGLERKGRIVIRAEVPEEYLDPWAQITIDGFDKRARQNEDKAGFYYEASVRVFVKFIETHDVKFRMQVLNHATNLTTPILIEEQIVPNRDVGLGPNARQDLSFGFYQSSPAEDRTGGVEVLNVEILRIDGLRDEEWVAPEIETDHVSDIWLITNPHDVPLALNWEYRKFDPSGELVQLEGFPSCAQNPDDFNSIHLQSAFVPPGGQIIVSKDISENEDDDGYTTELELFPDQRCQVSNSIRIYPDVNIELESAEREGNLVTLVVYNGSTDDAMGQLYVNVYDDQDDPVHGLVILLDSSNLLLQPGQSSKLSVYLSELLWEDPQPADFEFVFTGLRIER